MAHNCSRFPGLGREIVSRVNPDEEEFLAVITLMFWTTSECSYHDLTLGYFFHSQSSPAYVILVHNAAYSNQKSIGTIYAHPAHFLVPSC